MFYQKIFCEVCNRKRICRSEEKFPLRVMSFLKDHETCQQMQFIYRVKVKRVGEVKVNEKFI